MLAKKPTPQVSTAKMRGVTKAKEWQVAIADSQVEELVERLFENHWVAWSIKKDSEQLDKESSLEERIRALEVLVDTQADRLDKQESHVSTLRGLVHNHDDWIQGQMAISASKLKSPPATSPPTSPSAGQASPKTRSRKSADTVGEEKTEENIGSLLLNLAHQGESAKEHQ